MGDRGHTEPNGVHGLPFLNEISAPFRRIPSSSPRTSAFVQFKHNTTILAGMGFSVEKSQEALFRAVRNGVPLDNVLDASIELLLNEGEEWENFPDDVEAGRRRKSASEFEDIRASQQNEEQYPLAPDMRRAVSDPIPESNSESLFSESEINNEVRNVIFSSEEFSPQQDPGGHAPTPHPTTTNQPTANPTSQSTHASMATKETNCGICWDDLTDDTSVVMEGCGHTFCHECVNGWLSSNIKDGKLSLRCPSSVNGPSQLCRDLPPLPTSMIEDMITLTHSGEEPSPLLTKYRKFKEAKALESNTRVRWCTSPGCETAIHPGFFVGGLGGRRLRCPTCQHEQCYSCGRNYHGMYSTFAFLGISGTTCEDMTDVTLQEYSATKHLQPCPNCKKQVEKIDACPHMTCPCGHQWCWVCRGNVPCAGVHFGVSGSGSGEEVGNVLGVQRLSVAARFISGLCAPLFLAALLVFSLVGWSLVFAVYLPAAIVIAVKAAYKACGPSADHKYPNSPTGASANPLTNETSYTKASFSPPFLNQNDSVDASRTGSCENFESARRLVVNRFRRLGEAMQACVSSFSDTMCPDGEGSALMLYFPFVLIAGLTVFFVVFTFTYAIGVLCIGGAVLYLVVESVVACLKSSRRLRRFVCPRESDPQGNDLEVVPLGSSLDLDLDPTKHVRAWEAQYSGPLPELLWRSGRLCLAAGVYAVCTPVSLALSCVALPLYPFLPLPLLLNPRGRISFHKIVPLMLLLAAATTALIWAVLLRDNWSAGLGISGGVLGVFRFIEKALSFGGGSDHESQIIVVAVVFVLSLSCCGAWLWYTPSSLCSCCIPCWTYAYSWPLTIAVGRKNAAEMLAFTPPPDLPMQLPLLAAGEFYDNAGCCCEICGWESD